MEKSDNKKTFEADYPIRDTDINREFKYQVADEVGGEGLLRCLKCGACSGGCPVAAVTDYRPRKVLGDVLLGLRNAVISGDDLWECAACFTCEERCIQEVNFTDIVTVLRNIAAREGNAAPGYLEMAKRVFEFGRVSPTTRQVIKMREKLGLPPLQEAAIDDTNRIMRSTDFENIILAARREKEQ